MCHGALFAAAVASITPSARCNVHKAAKVRSGWMRLFASAAYRGVPAGEATNRSKPVDADAAARRKSSKMFKGFTKVSWARAAADSNPRASTPGSSGSTPSIDAAPARRKKTQVSQQEISFSVVIAEFARKGRPNVAEMFLKAMFEHGIVPNVFVFNVVIAAFAGYGHVAKAEAWFRRMEDEGLQPGIVALTFLIKACAKAGETDSAVRWFHAIEERGIRPNAVAYNAVINAFARRGDVKGAMTWFERMAEHAEPDQVSYNSVLHSCARSEKPRTDEAERTFRQMRLQSIPANASTMTCLEQAVGTDRRKELCEELGVDIDEALQRQGRDRKVRPPGSDMIQ